MSSAEGSNRAQHTSNSVHMNNLHQNNGDDSRGRAAPQQQQTGGSSSKDAAGGGEQMIENCETGSQVGPTETPHKPVDSKGEVESNNSSAQIDQSPMEQVETTRERAPLEAFADMPSDIMAEICGHLPHPSILQLARTAKSFRSFFLSRSASPLWAASRRDAGLPTLEKIKLNEVQYAVLLFGQPVCHVCQERKGEYDTLRFVVVCGPCRSEILVEEMEAQTTLSHKYHPETFSCVPFIDMLHNFARPPCRHYLRGDLEKTSAELFRLQQADDEESELTSTVALRTRGARKAKMLKVSTPTSERVNKFVAEQRKHWEEVRTEREGMIAALRIFEEEERAAGAEARLRRFEEERKQELARVAQRKADLLEIGWTEDDYIQHLKIEFTFPTTNLKPPKDDPIAWFALRDKEASYLDRVAMNTAEFERANALRARKLARLVLVKKKWLQLMGAEDEIGQAAFPRFSVFSKLPSVAPFWYPDPAVEKEGGEKASKALLKKRGKLARWTNQWETPTLDEGAWTTQIPQILHEVQHYRRTVDAYSVKIISFVLLEQPEPMDLDTEGASRKSFELISNSHPTLHTHLVKYAASPAKMTLQGARALYAILQLAGLDKDTATTKDLDDYGYIKWIEYSREVRLQVWEWRDLVRHATVNPAFSRNKPMTIVRAVPKLGRWF